MSPGIRWALVYFVLTVASYLTPGGRVMVIPFAFMTLLAVLFWSAGRSAAREDAEES